MVGSCRPGARTGDANQHGDHWRQLGQLDSDQKEIIQNLISRIDSINGYSRPVVTEVTPFKVFYPAEAEHQDYYRKNGWDPYIRNVSRPKVLKLRKTMPYLIKSEYKD